MGRTLSLDRLAFAASLQGRGRLGSHTHRPSRLRISVVATSLKIYSLVYKIGESVAANHYHGCSGSYNLLRNNEEA